jgi:hypothetical protein
MSKDGDCYGLTKISEILGAKDFACAKDLTTLSMAGRYKQASTVRERVRP